MSPQVCFTTESGVADGACSLVAMHFEVLGQRGEVPVNVSADSARKTPRALHHRLTGCIANVLPIASHPPCNTLTQPRDPPFSHHQIINGITAQEAEMDQRQTGNGRGGEGGRSDDTSTLAIHCEGIVSRLL